MVAKEQWQNTAELVQRERGRESEEEERGKKERELGCGGDKDGGKSRWRDRKTLSEGIREREEDQESRLRTFL